MNEDSDQGDSIQLGDGKNYKSCRERAQSLGKIFILRNNQADAVLLSIQEYEKLSTAIEYFEKLGRNATMDGINVVNQD